MGKNADVRKCEKSFPKVGLRAKTTKKIVTFYALFLCFLPLKLKVKKSLRIINFKIL